MKKLIAITLSSLTLSACMTSIERPENALECENPRPEMCTRDYRPVCGFDGSQLKTYGNHCSACADKKVLWLTPSACAQH